MRALPTDKELGSYLRWRMVRYRDECWIMRADRDGAARLRSSGYTGAHVNTVTHSGAKKAAMRRQRGRAASSRTKTMCNVTHEESRTMAIHVYTYVVRPHLLDSLAVKSIVSVSI